MSFREKDFLMRQIQQLIKGFGRMVTVESIKDFIHLDNSIQLTDAELDQLIITELLKETQKTHAYTDEEMAQNIQISLATFFEIRDGQRALTDNEKMILKKYLDFKE